MKAGQIKSIIALLVAVIVIGGCCRSTVSNPGTVQWEYKVISWSDLFKPLMIELEDSGKAKFFTDKQRTSWMIDFGNGIILASKSDAYLQKCLNELGSDGWELVSISGEKTSTSYIFKRRK